MKASKYLLVTSGLIMFLFAAVLTNAQNKIILSDDVGVIKETKKDLPKQKKNELFSEKKKQVKGYYKFDEPGKYAEYFEKIKTSENANALHYSQNYLIEEYQKSIAASRLNKTNALNWIERGPGNISGRTRGIVVDVSDPTTRTWFAGSVGGGVWKTTDAGFTWENKTNNLPNLSTSVIVQSKSNPDVLYCGTGEGFSNSDAINGSGIFKSTDHGNRWFQLASTANYTFYNVNRMLVDPANPNIVLAATNAGPTISGTYQAAGIHRSIDGGTTWTRVLNTISARVQDLRTHPTNFNILYAAVNNTGVYKSTDAGLTWNPTGPGLITNGRIEIAVSPKNPNYIYASVQTKTGSGLYFSEDAGATWTEVTASDGKTYAWLGDQGWYNNTIAGHPYNEKIIYMGGIGNWKVELQAGSGVSVGVKSIDEEGTISFLTFLNWGGSYRGGGIGTGLEFQKWTFAAAPFAESQLQVSSTDYVGVEVRFGPGKSQNAHRYYRVSSTLWEYKGYSSVPFEVWDIKNNRQLMISYRDWENDGLYNLKVYDSTQPREYLMIHAIPYDPVSPNPTLAVNNGTLYKMIWAIFPALPTGATWSPSSLPNSVLRINYGIIISRLASFTPITYNYTDTNKPFVHVDQHNITLIPKDEATNSFWFISGNDGGVALSTNGGTTWTGNASNQSISNGGYNSTQFYGVDKKPGANEYIGGMQDNGTWQSPVGQNASVSSIYKFAIGGDGFDVAWHHKDPNKIIGGSQYNNFRRTTNGGINWVTGVNKMEDVGSGKGQFISKIGESNVDPDVIFTTGSQGIWRSENFGDSWAKSEITTNDWTYNSSSTPVAISIADPQIVWAGHSYFGTASRLYLSTDGGLSFSSVALVTGFSLGTITGIDTHPTDPKTVYLTFSFRGLPKVLRTTDMGLSWVELSGFGSNTTSSNGFPDVGVFSLVVMPYNTNIIWAGTEIGLFESTDNGTTWHYSNNGLPAVSIWDIKVVDDQVILATHGRGIFSVTRPELASYQWPVVTIAPIIISAGQGSDKVITVKVNLRSQYDKTEVWFNGQKMTEINASTVGEQNLNFLPTASETAVIQIISYKDGKIYKTAKTSITLLDIGETKLTYLNNFDTISSDFTGNGFTIKAEGNLTSPAIHSLHDYAKKTTYTYTLTTPIKVANENAFLEYDDIAIVEPGDPGKKFGDTEFWDYVVVEGSKDGNTWIPIEDGYDSQYKAEWLAAYNSKTLPTPSMYAHHKVNLLNKFKGKDVILIRFRLFSDDEAVGWGWAIDNLSIQPNGIVGVSNSNEVPTEYSLEQNFPNPFNPETTIKFSLPLQSRVKLEIIDVLGRVVATLVDSNLDAGSYTYHWNASDFASGVYVYKITANNFSSSKKLMLVK